MIYLKKKETLFAIDKTKNTVWEVRNLNQNRNISKLPASPLLLELVGRDSQIIPAEEFINEFSEAVEFFHTETPFTE